MLGKAKKLGIGVGVLILLFFIVVAIAASGMNSQEERLKTPELSRTEIKQNALDGISYDDLLRNNEKYVGKIVHYTGEVLQAQNTFGDTYVLRVGVTEGSFTFSDVVWVNYAGSRVLDGDLIQFWGEVQGIKKYEAVLGNIIEIPEVDSLILEVIKKQG